ncbi:hypothetical protein GJU40_05090 [Bacillus lacus]|uniref:Lipoprotein n=1 Tax=Metabacillus lacus TaxID=1983721 RepID=A0A7X2IXE0_9BACI|nr:hypothetical protein [Metabacillus lacus]MRX71550.1 hypothetical protein [Metabacillus lacus]
MKRLNRNRYLCFILLILTVALTACTSSPDFEAYEGNSLRIAVVGEPPKVKEEQVRFTEFSFDEMASDELMSYDAVFIEEDHLAEASESQYADVYSNSTIPFFFISAKNFIPFAVKEIKYDENWSWSAGDGDVYAVGALNSQKLSWKYGLYNGKKTTDNIKDVYSRIFKTTDELNE